MTGAESSEPLRVALCVLIERSRKLHSFEIVMKMLTLPGAPGSRVCTCASECSINILMTFTCVTVYRAVPDLVFLLPKLYAPRR